MRKVRASRELRFFAPLAITTLRHRTPGRWFVTGGLSAFHPALLFTGLAAAMAVPMASAQAAPGDECAGIGNQADEIACLRSALSASNAELERMRSGNTGSRQATQGPAAPAIAAAPPAAPLSRPAQAVAPQTPPASRPTVAQAAPPAAVAPLPAPPAPVAASAPDAAARMGAEQVAKARDTSQSDRPPVLQATIVSNAIDREGLINFVLDNGQRWKQVERPTIQILLRNKTTYSCEITPSGFGGYRMFIPEIKRTIVVRRIN